MCPRRNVGDRLTPVKFMTTFLPGFPFNNNLSSQHCFLKTLSSFFVSAVLPLPAIYPILLHTCICTISFLERSSDFCHLKSFATFKVNFKSSHIKPIKQKQLGGQILKPFTSCQWYMTPSLLDF